MDIDLLSRMVRELIAGHDVVGLPGVGTFVAELMPASFSDKGYTINPPYRRLSFRQEILEGSLLVDFYAQANGLDRSASQEYLTKFLSELSDVLKDRKSVTFTGLGRLRATRENNFFFVPEPDLDIFPEGAGLAPVSLRTHAEAEEAPIEISVPAPVVRPKAKPVRGAAPVIDLGAGAADSADETVAVPEHMPDEAELEPVMAVEDVPVTEGIAAAETAPSAPYPPLDPQEAKQLKEAFGQSVEAKSEPAKPGRRADIQEQPSTETEENTGRRFRWWVPVLVIVGLAVIALCVFIALAYVAPDLIDSVLYTPEELQIINY